MKVMPHSEKDESNDGGSPYRMTIKLYIERVPFTSELRGWKTPSQD